MILPDVNLLVHACNAESRRHDAARQWWEGILNGAQPVGLPWAVMLGYIRLTTNRQILRSPLSAAEASADVRAWLARPNATVLHPGDGHADILFRLLDAVGTASNLTTDAHLAALAIEHQALLCSTDTDFAGFPGLRWVNPIA